MTMKKPFTPLRLSLIPVLTGTLILGLPIGSAAAPPAAPLKPGKICTGPTSGTYYQYAGGIIEGEESVPEVGKRMLRELLSVASGKPCKQEMHSRYREPLEMYATGPIL